MNYEEKNLEGDSANRIGDTGNASRIIIPVIQEELHIAKEVVETGRVKISKKVSEHQEHVQIPVTYDEVSVERVQINQFVETLPEPVRYEGETMIIPILKEVIVKRIMLVEEVRVSKKQLQRNESQDVTLRKEEISIERKQI